MPDTTQGIKFKASPIPTPNIGVEVQNDLATLLAQDEVLAGSFDESTESTIVSSLTDRNKLLQAIDEMAQDTLISSALELYADDCTEYNSDRQVIWATSDDPDISKMVNYKLKTLGINKDAWSHIYSMVKYGDVYLQTFRQSDEVNADSLSQEIIKDRQILKDSTNTKEHISLNESKSNKLDEKITAVIYNKKADPLVNYIEQVDNPAELMDLRKNGKCVGYLYQKGSGKPLGNGNTSSLIYRWNWKSPDIKLHDATKFIHIYLPNPSDRFPEMVQLFNKKGNDPKLRDLVTFKVVRGKSILSDLIKTYRELSLEEESLVLNRVVRSAILRIIQVEVGDMTPNSARTTLQKVKSKIEQSLSMVKDGTISEYNSGKTLENCIYLNTRRGLGAVSIETLGGDVNVKEIADIEYNLNKLFAGIKIPKEFLGYPSESGNMDPGTSLTKVSGRYAKTIKRIQNAYCQGIKTLINLFLLDSGMIRYINNFEIKMVEPTTLDSADRAENISTNAGVIETIMGTLESLPEESDKLEILLGLVKTYLDIPAVNEVVTRILDDLKNSKIEAQQEAELEKDLPMSDVGENPMDDMEEPTNSMTTNPSSETPQNEEPVSEQPTESEDEDSLPDPSQLGSDLEA